MSDKQVVVFLGPSLSLKEAHDILPNAIFLPPVKCGDILHSIRLKPKAIVIIDGLYESTAAVWHKEILFAINSGIYVIGAASMGALRAAELHAYNMIGIGQIFHHFKETLISDDDEVAILHAPAKQGYINLTDAMVNIRATLNKAQLEGVISPQESALLSASAKGLFYQERSLKIAVETAIKNGFNKQVAENLLNWVKNNNYVDQKKLDALEVLNFVKNNEFDKVNSLSRGGVELSIFFRGLLSRVSCQSFPYFINQLPIFEKVAIISKVITNFTLTQRLAYLLSATYRIAKSKELVASTVMPFGLAESRFDLNWLKSNDCDVADKNDLIKRIKFINSLIETVPDTSEQYMVYLKWLYCEPAEISLNEHDKTLTNKDYEMHKVIAVLWSVIDYLAAEKLLVPSDSEIQKLSEKFRIKRGLLTSELFNTWLMQQGVSVQDYYNFIMVLVRFDYLILRNNIDCLVNQIVVENNWWLLDALRLSDSYAESKQLLTNTDNMRTVLDKFKSKMNKEGESILFGSGFSNLEEFEELISSVTDSYKPIQ